MRKRVRGRKGGETERDAGIKGGREEGRREGDGRMVPIEHRMADLPIHRLPNFDWVGQST